MIQHDLSYISLFKYKKRQLHTVFLSCWLVYASLVAQMVKNPPAMQEPWVQSLGQEDPLEKGMALLLLLHYACLENLMDREG